MDTLLIFFLNRSFLDKVDKNQKPVLESPSCFWKLIKFIGFIYPTLIGWIFYTFQDSVQD